MEFLGNLILKLLSFVKAEAQTLIERQKELKAKKVAADLEFDKRMDSLEYKVSGLLDENARLLHENARLRHEISDLKRRYQHQPIIERRMVVPKATVNPTIEEAEYYPDILKKLDRGPRHKKTTEKISMTFEEFMEKMKKGQFE